jgi:hypothetical protein
LSRCRPEAERRRQNQHDAEAIHFCSEGRSSVQ